MYVQILLEFYRFLHTHIYIYIIIYIYIHIHIHTCTCCGIPQGIPHLVDAKPAIYGRPAELLSVADFALMASLSYEAPLRAEEETSGKEPCDRCGKDGYERESPMIYG